MDRVLCHVPEGSDAIVVASWHMLDDFGVFWMLVNTQYIDQNNMDAKRCKVA